MKKVLATTLIFTMSMIMFTGCGALRTIINKRESARSTVDIKAPEVSTDAPKGDPAPSNRSGVSDFTLEGNPALSDYYEISFVTLEDEKLDWAEGRDVFYYTIEENSEYIISNKGSVIVTYLYDASEMDWVEGPIEDKTETVLNLLGTWELNTQYYYTVFPRPMEEDITIFMTISEIGEESDVNEESGMSTRDLVVNIETVTTSKGRNTVYEGKSITMIHNTSGLFGTERNPGGEYLFDLDLGEEYDNFKINCTIDAVSISMRSGNGETFFSRIED